MIDVVSIGEVVIDFSPSGKGRMGNPLFEMNPGGAPANCLAANTKLGGSTAFIGMVGDDLFGNFLIGVLKDSGIETRGVVKTDKACTTLAFVSIDENGDRDFAFVRNPGADHTITVDDIDFSLIDECKILHCGSITLSAEP
ncbi:MAG: carbohydrate kinase, partial [Christensenellaceae bacterium]|nr:carbohydrate kinase [Christensenellaceae bacterium]